MIDWRPIQTDSGKRDAYAIGGHVDGIHAYTVARVTIAGRDQYEIWPRGASTALSRHDSAQAARAACLAHLHAERRS